MNVKKAVIPIAGKGTRFLPATKQIPKEMIPLLDYPMVHYAVEEAVRSGIEQVILVTSRGKESIEDYFDRNRELEAFLEDRDKKEQRNLIREIGHMAQIITVRQKEQLGLGHAILCAQPLVARGPFAVILGDDLILGERPTTKQLMDVSAAHGNTSVIGVMEILKEESSRYGVIEGTSVGEGTFSVKSMVEKPRPEEAPSNLATPGRYILTPAIFDCLSQIPRGVGGEYQLTDALNLLAQREPVWAYLFSGDRFDTGYLEGYLNATVEFALRRPDTRQMMIDIIKNKVLRYDL